MEEQNSLIEADQEQVQPQQEPQEFLVPEAPRKKRIVKKVILVAILALVLYTGYSILNIFISPDRFVQQVYLVPDDAAFIIQSSHPVADWKKFSKSESWQSLKKAKSFEEIAKNIEALDSIIHDNETLLSLVGKRDMLISLHKTKAADWDFLAIVDMQKMSKIELLKDQMENILKLLGSRVTNRVHGGVNIIEMHDAETQDILYLAFIDNHVVISYTSRLVEAAIDSRKNPKIGLSDAFIEVNKSVANKGLGRLFINYSVLPQFMSVYMDKNEYIDLFSTSMEFAGLYFDIDKEKIEMKGQTIKKELTNPYVAAILTSGKHKVGAQEIMPLRTALFVSIGLDNVQEFVKNLENTLSENDKKTYDEYVGARNKIESWFGISLNDNFMSWMSGEFAIAQLEPGLLGQEPELILAVKAKNIKDARKNMEFIEQRIKKRSPIKIKNVTYKDFDINYIELKGFFRLFFGKLFDKFEKPYYTYVDDYVVFSNKSSSLLSFVEDYEQKNLLKNDEGFKKAYRHYSSSSTLFLYVDMHKFYTQLRSMLTVSTWAEIQSNKDVLYSFPYWTLQIVGDNESASLHYVMDHEPYIAEPVLINDSDDEVLDEDAESEKELMNELKRFYVEKFEGNVLRNFYPGGQLKSESEVKEGKRHGRYREYYENGTLKLRGKYQSNRQKGTWKYYTEEGKFDRKEKY